MGLADLDNLLTLKDACEKVFDGAFTIATLRAEHRKGNLEIYRIGRRDFTTMRDIQEMKKKCRVEARVQGSGSIKVVKSGLSSMDEIAAAQASAQMKLQERRRLLGITSRRNTR